MKECSKFSKERLKCQSSNGIMETFHNYSIKDMFDNIQIIWARNDAVKYSEINRMNVRFSEILAKLDYRIGGVFAVLGSEKCSYPDVKRTLKKIFDTRNKRHEMEEEIKDIHIFYRVKIF